MEPSTERPSKGALDEISSRVSKMNYGLDHSRDMSCLSRQITDRDRKRLRAARVRKNPGFAAKYPGVCVTCTAAFPRLTLIKKNCLGQIVHAAGCPSKGGNRA